MTDNVALGGGGMFSWIRRIPILSGLFQRRHEKLSTVQFVEQLARSDAGARLGNLSRGARQRVLTALAYEYERFGDSQSSYFTSRARIMSVLFSVMFAFAANVDAFHIFGRLYTDTALRDSVIAYIEQTQGEREARVAAAQTGEAPTGEDLSNTAQSFDDDVRELRGLGLPVGYAAFPYCVNRGGTVDPRCNGVLEDNLDVGKSWARLFSTPIWPIYLLSVLTAGAFIGMGAPFWYSVFKRIAQIVPAAKSVTSAIGSGGASGPPPAPRSVRDPAAATPEGLTFAYDMASGDVENAVPPARSSYGGGSSGGGASGSDGGSRQYR
jgi:hypothetical protein